MMSEWVVFFGAVSILGGGCWLLMRDKKNNKQQPSIEDEHYRLGREHALAGKTASLATEAYQDGFADGRKAAQRKS
ncbi:TPA: hypothetical protein ACJ51G_001026 [Aeromonas hydrophila subsp. hydrophila]|uniref:hypothetical protein n=1 Tax=Aeromonas caviae TaxID=648 RepID=UPI000FEBD98A|nr:hypothetical protein [Aeromonas caviae]